MHPALVLAAATVAHAHTGTASTATHPPLIVMVAGSLIAGVVITLITSALRRAVN